MKWLYPARFLTIRFLAAFSSTKKPILRKRTVYTLPTFFVLFLSLSLHASYKVEGFGIEYDHDERLFLMATFLPYDPAIISLDSNPESYKKCSAFWPKGSFFYLHSFENGSSYTYDLIWIDTDVSALQILSKISDILEGASLVYTSTDLRENRADFNNLKSYLEHAGFTLLTHWYFEEGKGHALFLRNNLYHANQRTISYIPATLFIPPPGPPPSFKPWLHSVQDHSNQHSLDSIDFIYMINLDQRPEKFERCASELQLYGINPYRFSAVNGWELPTHAMDDIGAKFEPGALQEEFLGSTYLEDEDKEYIHTEVIQENGRAYFTRYLARGAIGIVLSHLSVLKDAYDSGFETIWVMEDDIDILEDPRKIPSLLKKLDQLAPDWDIFFTDTDTKNSQGVHVPCRALAARPNVHIPPLTTFLEKFYPIGDSFYRTGMRYGAYSMILRRSAIEKILHYYETYRVFIPYDMDFWLCPDLKMFYYDSDIISHKAGAASDNNKPRYKKPIIYTPIEK